MFANFVVIVILALTHRPGRESKLHKNPLLVYIPTGDIFILAKRVKHILVHGGNLDWHEGATLTGFSTYRYQGFWFGITYCKTILFLVKYQDTNKQ